VPSEVLFPPQGSYERVALPSLDDLIVQPASQPESLPTGDSASGDLLPGEIVAVQSGLNRPAGIAAGPDGRIYVADTGNKRVLILAPDGELQREVTGGAQPFQEPFDLATDPAGLVYVLDAGAGQIVVLDAGGAYLRTMAVDDTYAGRSRGMAIDADGRIWLANTTRGQIVSIDADGGLLQEVPVWPGEEAQVVDVIVAQDGSILATVLGVNKLAKYSSSGQRQISWDVPVANSFDSPHLAVDGAGFLYLTQPEESRVAKLAPTGERLGYWQLPTPPNMMKPVGVAADAQGRIWFVDVEGGRVAYIQP
jgi:DNA-binding beta-propeller fold protein YncE